MPLRFGAIEGRELMAGRQKNQKKQEKKEEEEEEHGMYHQMRTYSITC